MVCGVYKIENKINGLVYIGQSINIKKRWSRHKREICSVDINKFEEKVKNKGLRWLKFEEESNAE